MNCSPCLWYTEWKRMALNGSRRLPLRHVFLCVRTAKHWNGWLRDSGVFITGNTQWQVKQAPSGDRSCFRKDTRLDDLPRFLLSLFSYDCMHNKSDMSQKFPTTVHEQTICAKQSQYACYFLEAFYLLKQKYNSSTHLYKCLSRVIGKKSGRGTNPKMFS